MTAKLSMRTDTTHTHTQATHDSSSRPSGGAGTPPQLDNARRASLTQRVSAFFRPSQGRRLSAFAPGPQSPKLEVKNNTRCVVCYLVCVCYCLRVPVKMDSLPPVACCNVWNVCSMYVCICMSKNQICRVGPKRVYESSEFVFFCARISKYTGYMYGFGQPYKY
jgi:hypothetical protein